MEPSADAVETVEIPSERDVIEHIRELMHQRVVGQDEVIRGLLIALLTEGHVLLEGLPGLAKTLMVRSLADAIHARFQRIQFTPDLLPGDIVGTPVYHQGTGEFRVHKGPIFGNIILADEVNRAPPKVQAALLEAMEEEQVTIAGECFPLEKPFLVLATQNPIELHGTYPLAEAQLDRFMMKLLVGYPSRSEERAIVRTMATRRVHTIDAPASIESVFEACRRVEAVRLDDRVVEYIVELVVATREPEEYGLADMGELIEFGVSPRGSLHLTRAARAHAFLEGRNFVLPDDVKNVALPVMRHRIKTTYEADAMGISADDIVRRILDTVPSP